MKTLTRVLVQIHENYGFSTEPHWKAKGGREFEVLIDLDLLMYEKENCVKAMQFFLDQHSNTHIKYTYISHEPVFHTPENLCSEQEFENQLRAIYHAEK
jgi:hypothetical protein